MVLVDLLSFAEKFYHRAKHISPCVQEMESLLRINLGRKNWQSLLVLFEILFKLALLF